MSDKDNIANLTLEHLKYLRNSSDRQDEVLYDIKMQLLNVRDDMVRLERGQAIFDDRLGKIEKRLNLTEA